MEERKRVNTEKYEFQHRDETMFLATSNTFPKVWTVGTRALVPKALEVHFDRPSCV